MVVEAVEVPIRALDTLGVGRGARCCPGITPGDDARRISVVRRIIVAVSHLQARFRFWVVEEVRAEGRNPESLLHWTQSRSWRWEQEPREVRVVFG